MKHLRIQALLGGAILAGLIAMLGDALAQDERPGTVVLRGAEEVGPFSARRVDVDLRDLPRAAEWQPGMPIKEIPKRNNHQGKVEPPVPPANPTHWTLDPLVIKQQETFPGVTSRDFDTPILNFDGQGFSGVQPPDTVGDIGVDYYIQMINGGGGALFTVYNKSDGTVAAGPTALDSLGSDACASGLGDPIVLYDQLAGRWLLAEFSSVSNDLCFYISQTGDPISGGWFAYRLTEPPSFPDYFKIGVWPDAYYVSSNEGASAAYAFDRAAMLAGTPATGQRFTAAGLAAFGFQALQPADADGVTPPPASSPGIFIRHRDDEAHDPGSNVPTEDYLELYEFSVDFVTPANSTFTGPIQVAITEIDSELCGFTSFNCFPQPNLSTLDPLREVVMWRLQYRNMGSHEVMVGSLVTDVDGTDHGGVRWFELRQVGGGGWTLFQEGTYAPDAEHRWMSSIAMDANGNIAVGYSVSSTSIFAGIRYAGRLAADPAGTLPQGEHSLIEGLGNHSGNRWGDYSSMNVDPEDECTFWYTNEYGLANGNWQTRIGAFQLACEPNFTLNGTPLAQAVCAPDDLTPIDITVGQLLGFSENVTLSLENLPSGFTSAGGFTTNPVAPPGVSQVTVSVDNSVVPGPYGFDIEGSASGVDDKVVSANIQVFDDSPGTPTLTAPSNAATDQAVSPTLTWDLATQGSTYTVEIDDDSGFGSLEYTAQTSDTSHTVAIVLQADTEYFWRVRSSNTCGEGANSAVFSFRTADLICNAPNLAIPDANPTGVTDDLVIASGGTLTDVDVQIQATHSWVGDLVFELTHVDTATSVTLIDRPGEPALGVNGCSGDNIDATLDDEAALAVEDECDAGVPTIDGTFIPNDALSAFDGESLVGTWRITVSDHVGSDLGTLDTWCLLPSDSPSVDLNITKDDGVDEAMPGDTVVYTITVGNAGPADAVGAEVDDVFGADFDNVSWTCTPNGGASCSVGGNGDIDDTVDIPSGDTVVYEATVDLVGPGSEITNTATVTAPVDVNDTNGANNSASDTNSIILLEDGFESPIP